MMLPCTLPATKIRNLDASSPLSRRLDGVMSEDIKVTIGLGTASRDLDKLRRIIEEMRDFKTTASTKDEAKRKYAEELRRRLVDAGLSK